MKNCLNLILIGLVVSAAGPRAPKATSDAVYTCPAGYNLQGKECIRKTHIPGRKVCRVGHMMAGQCVAPGMTENYCPPGSVQVGKSCQIKDTELPQSICPPGTHDIGGECQTYSVTGIVEKCAIGEVENGECAIYEAVPAIKKAGCPIGYSEAKGSCWKTVQMECSPPYQGKRLLQAKGSYYAQGKGIPQVTSPAPLKYVPTMAKLAVKSKKCEVKLEAEPVASSECPSGSHEKNGQCLIRTVEPTEVACSLGEDYLCFPHQSAPAIQVCPPGSQLHEGLCVKLSMVSHEIKCAEGSVPGPNGDCIKFLGPPEVQCPPGTEQIGDDCFGKETVAPTVQVTVTCTGKNCYNK